MKDIPNYNTMIIDLPFYKMHQQIQDLIFLIRLI